MKNGKQSRGKFTQFKDLYFPKGCGSLDIDLLQKHQILKQISPQARSFKAPSKHIDIEHDNIPSAQTLNEIFAPAPQTFSFDNVPFNSESRRSGSKSEGFYYPDLSGRFVYNFF